MYTKDQLELLEKVDQLFEKKKAENPKFTQNHLAELLGMSATALSQLRRGNYQADPQRLFDVLKNYFDVKEKASQNYCEVHYAPTSISTHIYELIGVCQATGGLTIAIGDAGIGKTKAAQKFVEDNPINSYLINVNPCLTSIKSLLKALATEIGAIQERSCDELWTSIVKKLSDGTVLIFDEAQNLTIKEIETLRSFSDYFYSRRQTLGICFIGNEKTLVYKNSKAEFAQISNRVRLKRLYSSGQIQIEDIQMLFPILTEQKMKKELEFLHRIAKTSEAIRGATDVFLNAYFNDNYTYDGLRTAASNKGIKIQ